MKKTALPERLATWYAVLGSIGVLALVAITIVAVIFRYAFNSPIFGITDLSKLGLVMVAAGSLAYGASSGSHVFVDIIGPLGKKVTRWTDLAVKLISLGMAGVVIYALSLQASCGVNCGYMSANIGIPFSPFYYMMIVGFLIYAILLITELTHLLSSFFSADE